jgi:hypothetical protein
MMPAVHSSFSMALVYFLSARPRDCVISSTNSSLVIGLTNYVQARMVKQHRGVRGSFICTQGALACVLNCLCYVLLVYPLLESISRACFCPSAVFVCTTVRRLQAPVSSIDPCFARPSRCMSLLNDCRRAGRDRQPAEHINGREMRYITAYRGRCVGIRTCTNISQAMPLQSVIDPAYTLKCYRHLPAGDYLNRLTLEIRIWDM